MELFYKIIMYSKILIVICFLIVMYIFIKKYKEYQEYLKNEKVKEKSKKIKNFKEGRKL